MIGPGSDKNAEFWAEMPFLGGVVANELNCGNGGPPNSFQTGSKTLALEERTLGGSIRGEKRKCKLPEACSFAELAVLYIKSNSFGRVQEQSLSLFRNLGFFIVFDLVIFGSVAA